MDYLLFVVGFTCQIISWLVYCIDLTIFVLKYIYHPTFTIFPPVCKIVIWTDIHIDKDQIKNSALSSLNVKQIQNYKGYISSSLSSENRSKRAQTREIADKVGKTSFINPPQKDDENAETAYGR